LVPAASAVDQATAVTVTKAGGAAAEVTGADTTGADATGAAAEAARTGKVVEISSLRGESREVFATPEGNVEAREHLRPVRTRVDGKWQDIDTSLTKRADGTVTPKATTVGLAFSGGGSDHSGRAMDQVSHRP
jgi:hypothetical protein